MDPYFEPQVFSGKRKRAHTKKLVDEQSSKYLDDDFVIPDDEDFQSESEISEEISEEEPVRFLCLLLSD